MKTSMRRRLDALECHAPAQSGSSRVAVVWVDRLGTSADEITDALGGSWASRCWVYLLTGSVDALPPTSIDALNAEAERRWFDAASTYPHVLAVIDGEVEMAFRFETQDAERRFGSLPLAEKEKLLVGGDRFAWVK